MKIFMACPAPPRSLKGNRVTAVRWARILQGLGHRLTIGQDFDGQPCDLMVALHARKSHEALRHYRQRQPHGPLVLCLTGTDLYHDIRTSKKAQRSLELADRLVLLQPHGIGALPPRLRKKARVVIQSAAPVAARRAGGVNPFDVAVLGHLRAVKDPFRAALALRHVPAEAPIRVLQLGLALSPAMAARARQLMKKDRRYRWLGPVPYGKARRILARSRLMVISSKLEGGANVISEALADGVPILASRMSGNIGLLGADYPGYFPVGDARALARLLVRAASDAEFYARLKKWCVGLAAMVQPKREREAWEKLLEEFEDGERGT